MLSVVATILAMPALGMTQKAQKEIADMIVTGDYQKMRNVAYGMENGSFGHDKNLISACAIRRVILLAHTDKATLNDYANEAIACRKVDVTKNQQAWQTTMTFLKSALAKKK